MTAPQPLMTTAEVAAAFGVNEKTVTRWRKAGKVASIPTPGGHFVRFFRAEIDARLAGKPLTAEQVKALRAKLLDGAP